ncbi:outer membrane beta-barrel protein [Vibrio sp. CAIM 722]|uniref:Outer membrane beta-barrel protein n=1 Tax=Vibrio eleionomae TaxID=2653505 RepID=A0A7X4LJT8_9VIBR|nr:OmpA family protein [Vibrio eleionomae]MZI92866.1 outer membrane beta-barrel protein [Vibrio eleionomae]
MKKNITLTLIAGLVGSALMAQSAFADVYVGGRAGYSFLDDACYQPSGCDDDDGAAGLFLGYQANDWFGVELGADWLGNHDVNYMDNGSLSRSNHNLSAISLAPKFTYNINPKVDVFAKVGAAYMQFGDDNDTVPTAAVGAEYHLTKQWDARVSYQRYQDMSDDVFHDMDTNLVSVGLSYKFGQSEPAPAPQPAPQPKPEPIAKAEPAPQPAPKPRWVIKQHGTESDQSLFALESAELTEKGKEAFTPLLETLRQYPNAEATITGYTDSTGSEKYNQQLSEKRAQAVANFLIEGGVQADKLTVKGKGESNPIASNATLAGRKQNRRVEVDIPSFDYKVKQTPATQS